jgi:hypothetical protein
MADVADCRSGFVNNSGCKPRFTLVFPAKTADNAASSRQLTPARSAQSLQYVAFPPVTRIHGCMFQHPSPRHLPKNRGFRHFHPIHPPHMNPFRGRRTHRRNIRPHVQFSLYLAASLTLSRRAKKSRFLPNRTPRLLRTMASSARPEKRPANSLAEDKT